MVKFANRASMETATTGTGTITLGAAVAMHQTFADAGVVDGDTVAYVIEDGVAWEIGTGVYSSTGPTLTRTVTESTNSDAALSLSGGATVFIDVPASYFNAAEDYGLITGSASATDDYGSVA